MIQPTKYHQIIWSLFDWANTVWPVVIITFVFPNYFINQVCQDPTLGNIYWANTMTISGVCIAFLAPFIGSLADSLNNTTLWLRIFTIINIICAYALWFIQPHTAFIYPAMAIIILGSIAFEISTSFYNSYLVHITTSQSELSRISGLAWGLGYTAGISCLLFCIVFLITPEQPLLGWVHTANLEHIRIIGPIVGTWYLLFGTPLLLEQLAPQQKKFVPLKHVFHETKQHILLSLQKTKDKPYIYYYLLIRMIYTDGLNTLFSFAGIYAASTFQMDFKTIMYFGICCNIAAGLGCFVMSWFDSRLGELTTIRFSLFIIILLLSSLLLVNDEYAFWALALTTTFFIGPIQASSRSLMAKICPENAEGEFFGLYALSGKISAFLGPLLLGTVVSITNSQRLGMGSINLFFILGFIGMFLLNIPKDLITKKVIT